VFGKSKTEENTPRSPSPSASKTAIETVVGPNAYFKGDIQSDSGVRVDGIFEGTIDITGNLVIGEGAKVVADIKAENVSISGAVKGNITGNRVEILDTGRVWGDLAIKSLLLNEGAYLRGQTTMQGDIEPPMIEPPRSSEGESAQPTILDVEPKEETEEEEEE